MTTNKGQKTQRGQFIEAVRKLGVDEDEASFRAKLRKIARADVPVDKRKKPKRKKD